MLRIFNIIVALAEKMRFWKKIKEKQLKIENFLLSQKNIQKNLKLLALTS
jgi:hypothetical protein